MAILKQGRIAFHGELDALKDQVKRLHVIAARVLPGMISFPSGGGEVLHQRVNGNEAILSVRHLQLEMVEELRTRLEATVEIEDLNLEDVFLELHEDAAQV